MIAGIRLVAVLILLVGVGVGVNLIREPKAGVSKASEFFLPGVPPTAPDLTYNYGSSVKLLPDPTPVPGLINGPFVSVYPNGGKIDLGNYFTIEGLYRAPASFSAWSVHDIFSAIAARTETPAIKIARHGRYQSLTLIASDAQNKSYQIKDGPTVIQPNTWYHFAAIKDGSTLRLFVNGRWNGSYQMDSAPRPLGIFFMGAGQYNSVVNDYLEGEIDEIRVSSTVRYNADFIPPSTPFVADANTIALYHFDADVLDYSGNSHNGTVINGNQNKLAYANSAIPPVPTGKTWETFTPKGYPDSAWNTASKLLLFLQANGFSASEVRRWIGSGWETRKAGDSGVDFPIVFNNGYLVIFDVNPVRDFRQVLTFSGSQSTFTYNLVSGWNFVGLTWGIVPRLALVESLCQEIKRQGGQPLELHYSSMQASAEIPDYWPGHTCGQSANNFTIDLDGAVFIKMAGNAIVTLPSPYFRSSPRRNR